MIRAWFLIVVAVALVAEEAPLDPKVQRILDDYRDELVQAADHYTEAVADARSDTVRDLKRQVRSSTPVPERVAIMREVLRIDRNESDARAFFQTLGTLEDELAALGEGPEQALAVDLLAPASVGPAGGLRALVEASPAAAALAESLAADPQAPIHAAYAGGDEDLVGAGNNGQPDGTPDGRIDLLVTVALGTLVSVDVNHNGRWVTGPNGSWIVGVVANGERLNPGKQQPVGDVPGPALLSLYCNQGAQRWKPGETVRVVVEADPGSRHELQVTIPGVGAGAATAASRR